MFCVTVKIIVSCQPECIPVSKSQHFRKIRYFINYKEFMNGRKKNQFNIVVFDQREAEDYGANVCVSLSMFTSFDYRSLQNS